MINPNNKQTGVKVGLLLAAIASSVYLLMLGWYNTLSLDDYMFLADIEQQGRWGIVRDMYMNWQGRFSAFFVSAYLMPLFGGMPNMLPYTLFQMLLGTSVIYLMFKWSLIMEDRLLTWVVALLVNNVSSLAILESSTYYWLCCEGYFYVSYATILLIGLLLFSECKSWIRWVGVVLMSLYISGASESYTPLVILVLGLYFLWFFFAKKQFRFWENERLLMLFISLLIMGVGFLFMLFAPGNKVRMGGGAEAELGFMQHFQLVPFVMTSIKATAVLSLRLLSRSLWYLAVFPIFVWLGVFLAMHGEFLLEFKFKQFLISLLALILFIFISVAACVFGFGWNAPSRSESYMSFVLMAFVAYWGIGIGGRAEKHRAMVWTLACCSSLVLTVMMIAFFVEMQPEAKNYHTQIIHRNTLIKEQVIAERTEPLSIEPLHIHYKKNSYYLLRNGIYHCFGKTFIKDNELWYPYVPSILVQDPCDFRNAALQRYYNAQFEIIGDDKDLLYGEEQ